MSYSKISRDSEMTFNGIYRGTPKRVIGLCSVKITSSEPPELPPRIGVRTAPSNFKLSTLTPKTPRSLDYWNWLDDEILVSSSTIFSCFFSFP